jgi:hypothetical protein
MKPAVERNFGRFKLIKKQNEGLREIEIQEKIIHKFVQEETRINAAKVYYAASKISALVRGFLDRIVARKRRLYVRAIKLIQKVMKGKLGRIRWKREYWRSISVVKSDHALKELIERSKLLREQIKVGRFGYHWQEYFDSLTESFWYLNHYTKQNTWEVPFCFQDKLVCSWNTNANFGALTNSKPCRAVFRYVEEYHNHLRNAHKWNCIACFQSNIGFHFPICTLCGNKYNTDGIDGEKILQEQSRLVHEQLLKFLKKDIDMKNVGIYRIRDRMVDIAIEQKKIIDMLLSQQSLDSSIFDTTKQLTIGTLSNNNDNNNNNNNNNKQLSSSNRSESMKIKQMQAENYVVNTITDEYFNRGNRTTSTSATNTTTQESLKLPSIMKNTLQKAITSSSILQPVTTNDYNPHYTANNNNNNNNNKSRTNTASNTAIGKGGKGLLSTTNQLATNNNNNNTDNNNNNNTDNNRRRKPMRTKSMLVGQHSQLVKDILAPLEPSFEESNVTRIQFTPLDELAMELEPYKSVTILRKVQEQEWEESGGWKGIQEREIPPLYTGQLDHIDFDLATSIHDGVHVYRKRLQRLILQKLSNGLEYSSMSNHEELNNQLNADTDDTEEEEEEDQENHDHEDLSSLGSLAPKQEVDETIHDEKKENSKKSKLPKLLVCPQYIEGKCTLTTCPFAHPGLRDQARIYYKIKHRNDGSKQKIPFVFLCPFHTSHSSDSVSMPIPDTSSVTSNSILTETGCPRHKHCSNYHVYIRPSTQAIIHKLYPKETGFKHKTFFKQKAELIGHAKMGLINGYGRMTWSNGSVYVGDWVNELRQGIGMYRNPDGDQYLGEYYQGKRHGWGIYTCSNGEEYIGEWFEGKMHGVGMLKAMNGDIYQGEFVNGRYHGMGWFMKANGDVFMGYHQNNCAEGLGIQSKFRRVGNHSEKYKGYFSKNARHGKGACYYGYHDGSWTVYMGDWYRGTPEGYGIFQTSQHEKYIGKWSAGKKHGMGRYFFRNHDFYDGEFFKDQAQGVGVYYHVHGNFYTGEWKANKRHGKGTYVFANGSKYTGHWEGNWVHQKGKFDFANGCHYRGHFQMNQKHGKGIYTWANGSIYRGEFYLEKLHGMGEVEYASGHRYYGHWKDNQKNGRGTFYYKNNSAIYSGEFKNDLRHGFGKLVIMPNTEAEESYEGEWVDDQWHGKGKYMYTTKAIPSFEDQVAEANRGLATGEEQGGSTDAAMKSSIIPGLRPLSSVYIWYYDGDWLKNIRQGHGTLYFTDHSYYRGEFQKDQFWGTGVYVDPNTQTQYEGMWRANMRHGHGTSLEPDGSIYTGEYFSNMKQGEGKLQRSDGSIYYGTWDAGVIIGKGRVLFPVGDPKKKDGLKKNITCKVFGY